MITRGELVQQMRTIYTERQVQYIMDQIAQGGAQLTHNSVIMSKMSHDVLVALDPPNPYLAVSEGL